MPFGVALTACAPFHARAYARSHTSVADTQHTDLHNTNLPAEGVADPLGFLVLLSRSDAAQGSFLDGERERHARAHASRGSHRGEFAFDLS